MSYNQFTDILSYKHYHDTFKKNTVDFYIGKESLEPWDKESVIDYCTDNFEHMIRYNDYTHEFEISKIFFIFFECNYRFEFEEKVLDSILRNLCNKYNRKFEEVQKKSAKCVSYGENFN